MLRILQQYILTVIFATFATQSSAMFIQPDWYDPTQPGVGTNRYSYSGNDPINRLDPNGNYSWQEFGEDVSNFFSGFADGFQKNADLNSTATMGAAGAATGALYGANTGVAADCVASACTTSPVLGTGLAARGALSGATGTTTGSVVGTGQLPSATELAIGTGLGAVTGPLSGRTGSVSGRFTGSLDDLTAAERSFVQRELAAGRNIEAIPTGSGRTADFFIDGVQTELKTMSGVRNTSSNGISSAMASRIMDARGQSGHIVVDLTGQNGVTREIAERGIARAYGADRSAGIQSIRAVGDDFDITVPRSN